MKILFNVDQRKALRLGIDAPASTGYIDVDPSELTEEEREYLAVRLQGGHDCTRDARPVLTELTLQGLHEALADCLAEQREKAEEQRQEKEQRIAAAREIIASGPSEKLLSVGLHEDGTISAGGYGYVVKIKCNVPDEPYVPYVDRLPELRAELDAFVERIKKQRDDLLESKRPELEALKAELEQAQAALAETKQALYARLPESLRNRHAAGFASASEVADAVAELLRSDAGLPPPAEYGGYEDLKQLTDAEFSAFEQVRGRAPKGAEVEPIEVWDLRPEEDDDDPDDVDGDGQVKFNFRRFVWIRWSVAGYEAVSMVPLG